MTNSPTNVFSKLRHAGVPRVFEVTTSNVEGVRALFFEGQPWKGKATRVFAYCGIPERARGQRVPGMVLVHGGGGSAFIPWVQLWMSRGYAAIAMDTCGCISGGITNHTRDEHGGPPGWGGFDEVDEPVEDQWSFHAVADVLLAHSLLQSFPEVDENRIGITGVSWGGYLTCIAAGNDDRFSLAAPVYGCGFLRDNSTWLEQFKKLGPARAERWASLWDPSVYLPDVRCPMLWVNGTNDFAYPMDSWQKSYRLPSTPRTLSLRLRMPHGHQGPGENPVEIHAFAQSIFSQGAPLPAITSQSMQGRLLRVEFASSTPIVRAELNYTTDTGLWVERNWQTLAAEIPAGKNVAEADVPEQAAVAYLNLFDERDCAVSSEHILCSP